LAKFISCLTVDAIFEWWLTHFLLVYPKDDYVIYSWKIVLWHIMLCIGMVKEFITLILWYRSKNVITFWKANRNFRFQLFCWILD
jgi:hypothetical protein